ncbi:MAG: hypothetical protein OFPII_22320 [Osedax symbiont Rs1]|nr:MAG: hypothetical protein OFPII_22320 [Osedax symbiont Rs1]
MSICMDTINQLNQAQFNGKAVTNALSYLGKRHESKGQ